MVIYMNYDMNNVLKLCLVNHCIRATMFVMNLFSKPSYNNISHKGHNVCCEPVICLTRYVSLCG